MYLYNKIAISFNVRKQLFLVKICLVFLVYYLYIHKTFPVQYDPEYEMRGLED